jgi:hypothetical protein
VRRLGASVSISGLIGRGLVRRRTLAARSAERSVLVVRRVRHRRPGRGERLRRLTAEERRARVQPPPRADSACSGGGTPESGTVAGRGRHRGARMRAASATAAHSGAMPRTGRRACHGEDRHDRRRCRRLRTIGDSMR